MFSRIYVLFLFCFASFQLLGIPKIDWKDLERPYGVINYSIVQKNNVGQDPMGKGPYGDVYKGLWRGAPVAIKKYQKATLPKHLEDEFDIYDQAKHPYIVPVHGICDEPGKFSLVYQFHPYNLSEYINGENYKPNLDFIIPNARRLARVIAFMHSRNLMLMHLKSSNILLDEKLELKVTDFGLSKIKLEKSDAHVSIRWRAPESFVRGYKFQKSADIYAFGIILWEMLSGQKPFAGLNESQAQSALSAGARPPIQDSWPKEIKDLLSKCWNPELTQRPNADALLKHIEENFKGFTDKVAVTAAMEPKLVDQGKVTVVLMQDKKEVKSWPLNLSELSGQKFVSDEQELFRFEKTSSILRSKPQHIFIEYPITAFIPVTRTPLSAEEQSEQPRKVLSQDATKPTKTLSQKRSPMEKPKKALSENNSQPIIKAERQKRSYVSNYAGWNFSKAPSKNLREIVLTKKEEPLEELTGEGLQIAFLTPEQLEKTFAQITAIDWVIVRMEGVYLSTGHTPKGGNHYPFRATDREGISSLISLQDELKFRLIFLRNERVREEDAKYVLKKVGFNTDKIEIYQEKMVGIGSIVNELEEIKKYYSDGKSTLSKQKLRSIPQQIVLFEPSMEAIRASTEMLKHDPIVLKEFSHVKFNLFFKDTDKKLYDSSDSSLFPDNLKALNFSREENHIVILQNKGKEYVFGAWLNPDEANEKILSKAILHMLYPENFAPLAVYNQMPTIEEVQRKFLRTRSQNMQSPGPFVLLPYSQGMLQKDEMADRNFSIAHLILKDLGSDSHSFNLPGSKLDNPDAVPVHSSLDFHRYDSIWYDYPSVTVENIVSIAKKLYPGWHEAEAEIRIQAQNFLNKHKAILEKFSQVAQAIQVENVSELKSNLRHRLDHLAKIFSLDQKSSNYLMFLDERETLEKYYQMEKDAAFSSSDPAFKSFYRQKTGIEYNEIKHFLRHVYDVMKLSPQFINEAIGNLDDEFARVWMEHYEARGAEDRAFQRKLERIIFAVAKQFAAKVDLSELELIIASNPQTTWNFYTLLYGDKWDPEKQQKLYKDIHDFVYSFSSYEAKYPKDLVVKKLRSLIGSRIMQLIAQYQKISAPLNEVPEELTKKLQGLRI